MMLVIRPCEKIIPIEDFIEYCGEVLNSTKANPLERGGLERVVVQAILRGPTHESGRNTYDMLLRHALRQNLDGSIVAAQHKYSFGNDHGESFDPAWYVNEQLGFIGDYVQDKENGVHYKVNTVNPKQGHLIITKA